MNWLHNLIDSFTEASSIFSWLIDPYSESYVRGAFLIPASVMVFLLCGQRILQFRGQGTNLVLFGQLGMMGMALAGMFSPFYPYVFLPMGWPTVIGLYALAATLYSRRHAWDRDYYIHDDTVSDLTVM